MIGINNAIDVLAGCRDTLILKSDGTMWSCGENNDNATVSDRTLGYSVAAKPRKSGP